MSLSPESSKYFSKSITTKLNLNNKMNDPKCSKLLDFSEITHFNVLKDCTNTLKNASDYLEKSISDREAQRESMNKYKTLKEYFCKNGSDKVEDKPSNSHFSGKTAESDLQFEYMGSFGVKNESRINLVTDGSENIQDDTDV
jgi:hypothetical protein